MAKLTAKRRNALPAKTFAIKAKIRKKFPGIAMKMDGGAVHQRMDRPSRRK